MSEAEVKPAAQSSTASAPAPVTQQPQCVEADSSTEQNDVVLAPPVDTPVHSNPMDELGSEEEEEVGTTAVPSNTPVTADSGQGSPTMKSSSESLSDEPTAAVISASPDSSTADVTPACNGDAKQEVGQGEAASATGRDTTAKEAKKLERKEEKKRHKKKEDKGIEYILRALNSLQTPEEKLAALCKKYADLNEEHRVLQTSFKTQQRTMTMVMREKDQLQADHTRAMMAKGKLESLCRELQKHNKIIKEESIKRAKEDDEKRKEISQQFNNTIGEIQTQMSENTERNSKLRQENENLASQLKAFINSIELRDQQVEKLQKHHELEKKLFEAKMKQAEAVLSEHTEKNNKERELVMLKLAESNKKNAVLEAQVSMFKERYAEFEQLHSRSSETFQKYKTEMDKMTKRIKKLEKDGLQWKIKWEKTNGALIEQVEARGKSEKEALTYAQKTRKLESLCRALQAELHNKKPAVTEENGDDTASASTEASDSQAGTAPPNSPQGSAGQDSSEQQQPPSSTATTSLPSSTESSEQTVPSSPLSSTTTTSATSSSSAAAATSSSEKGAETTEGESLSSLPVCDVTSMPPADFAA